MFRERYVGRQPGWYAACIVRPFTPLTWFSAGSRRRVSSAWRSRTAGGWGRPTATRRTRPRDASRSPSWRTTGRTRTRWPAASATTWPATARYDADIRIQGRRSSSPWKCCETRPGPLVVSKSFGLGLPPLYITTMSDRFSSPRRRYSYGDVAVARRHPSPSPECYPSPRALCISRVSTDLRRVFFFFLETVLKPV